MYMMLSDIMNCFGSEFSASNDENKENFSERESNSSSFQSTPSEFDKSLVEKFRPLDEKKLLDRIFHFLDELDADFVFSNFEELEVCQFFWVSKMCLKKFDAIEIVAVLNKIGKRMTFYSDRASVELVFLLTDWMKQSSVPRRELLSIYMAEVKILNSLRILLSTKCHSRIRPVMEFLMAITSHLGIGSFSRKAIAMAIRSKIAWIADEKEPMDYLSELSIGEADQIVYRRLRALSYDSEVDLLKETHGLAKEVMKRLE